MSNTNGTSILTITAEQIQYEAQQYERAFNILQVWLNKKTCYMSTMNMVVKCQFGKPSTNIKVMVKRPYQGHVNTSAIAPHNTWQVVSADEHIVYPAIPTLFNRPLSAYSNNIQPPRDENALLGDETVNIKLVSLVTEMPCAQHKKTIGLLRRGLET